MFTGIIQTIASVIAIHKTPGLNELVFDFGDYDINDLALGASVAINGACLTVTAIENSHCHFEAMASTLEDTTLGQLCIGDKVNIERAARFGDEIGGHILSGHVQGLAKIIAIEQPENNYHMTLSLPEDYQHYIFKKAYIAINGISLTIQSVQHAPFQYSVHIISETLKRTNLSLYHVGDDINFEIDPQTIAIVDTVKAFLIKT